MSKIRHLVAAATLTGALGVTAAGVALASSGDRSGHGAHAAAAHEHRLTPAQRNLVRSLTRQYRDVDVAIAAGYLPTDECVAVPGLGGMGYHYVHPEHIDDGVIDIATPDVLVYHDAPNGGLRLGAVEYLIWDADQDLTTDDDRPFLFDQHPFDGPMEGHGPGMPRHYDLHVWLYERNPAGELIGFNPRVSCPD